ncbi:hypothetical protein RFI_31837 [Reticulomyxa filosa]|uniref:glutathione transferase n=1 Tax=Reticulomyxa filosa TaxID=46433 RepID=X6LVB6_RETFI|nr:hypothetical protein RFI_31837 [Reticulomyxa filosa]|eukprot:ETO05559.1 hypothetical protein RFI_31837 [Reticulomyxa filosa]
MLVYGGHNNFEDMTYEVGPAPTYDRLKWLDVKFKLGLEFPNLPYLINHSNDLRITEFHAIYRYLGRELKIGSSDSQGRAYEEMIGDIFKDFVWPMGKIVCYSPNFESQKTGFIQQFPDLVLRPLEKWLKGDRTPRKWLGGKDLCYADFLLFEFIEQTSKLCGEMYEKFPELTRFYKAFKVLEPLQNYFKNAVLNILSTIRWHHSSSNIFINFFYY